MTPAIMLARKLGLAHHIHQYQHDAASSAYGLEALEKLALAPESVFKTLVIKLDGQDLAVAIIPVAEKLSLKAVAKAAGAKKAQMATPQAVERSTGYVLGGVSPLGQKKILSTYIDSSAEILTSLYVSAGRRGLEIELCPKDLARTLKASFVELCA